MLELSNITKTYRDNTIFSSANLSAPFGHCLGIVGENGSGKSTLLRIAGQIDRDFTGDILLDGQTILGKKSIIRQEFAYVPQEDGLAEFLTVSQQIEFWQKTIEHKNEEILELLDIAKIAKKPIASLSGGQKKRLSIAMALQSRARFIIMDEAFAALDSNYCQRMTGWIKKAVADGATVLWCSHQKHELSDICDSCVYIKNGVISSHE